MSTTLTTKHYQDFTMRKLLWILLLLPLMASACKKDQNGTDVPDKPIVQPEIPLSDSVFFYEQRLFAPGDYGSKNYRIPAICTLNDGTLLVVNDRRKNNEGDLPQDIDIVYRRSTDNGRTWSEPEYLIQGRGYKKGYGDPALVVCENGDVLCAFCGWNGFWQSTEADPEKIFISRSIDGGITWQEPVDITSIVWGSLALNPECRTYKGAFIASGNGLRLQRGEHKGRILFVAALCRGNENVPDNYVVYSDDNGNTWQMSECAYRAGDEAKVIELSDGKVLMSIRQNGARGYNISEDAGVHWGQQGKWNEMTTNACNGDMLRLCAVDQGGERNILLHSIPNSMEREKVSVFISYDEGRTWQDPVLLCPGLSVYSSLTLQHDGTIGVYVEKNTNKGCELWYQNFTYAWLLEQLKK